MTSNNTTKFIAINKFMELIKAIEHDDEIEFIDIYFIPSQAFRNQYNNISIKPVALLIKCKDKKATSLKYDDMVKYITFMPIISFKQNSERRVYKSQALQKLHILNKIKEYDEYKYYESKIMTCMDQLLIEKIKQCVPDRPHTSKITDDNELFEF